MKVTSCSVIYLLLFIGHIVLDLCSFKNKDILDCVYLKHLTSEECKSNMGKFDDPEPHRYVIPLNVISDVSLNFISTTKHGVC